MPERLRAAHSQAPQRHPDDVASVIESLHRVHEAAHQKEAASILTKKVLGNRGIDFRGLEVEAAALVRNFDDEALTIDFRPHVHVLVCPNAIPVEDRIRKCFGECDGDVQRQLARRVRELRTLPRDHRDNVLDVPDVTWDVELDGQADVLDGKSLVAWNGHARVFFDALHARRGEARSVSTAGRSAVAATRLAPHLEALESALARVRDLKERVQLRQLEQRLEVVVEVGEAQFPALLANLLRE
jgi:predicted nucleic acid-binding Zn ribbon protein